MTLCELKQEIKSIGLINKIDLYIDQNLKGFPKYLFVRVTLIFLIERIMRKGFLSVLNKILI